MSETRFQELPAHAQTQVQQGQPWMHPRANRQIQLGDGVQGSRVTIAYCYEVAARKSIGLTVTPEGLRVRAPRWVTQKSIEACLHEKARWILEKIQAHAQSSATDARAAITWANGSRIAYLGQTLQLALGFAGRQALLQVREPAPESLAVPSGDAADWILHLPLPAHASAQQIERGVRQWLRHQALHTVQQRVQVFAPAMGVQPKRVSLTSALTRWGSASSSGAVRLHWRLIQMPPRILDYVVIHELAHLHEMNHGPQFWAWVARFMPDYAHWRAQLKAIRLPRWE